MFKQGIHLHSTAGAGEIAASVIMPTPPTGKVNSIVSLYVQLLYSGYQLADIFVPTIEYALSTDGTYNINPLLDTSIIVSRFPVISVGNIYTVGGVYNSTVYNFEAERRHTGINRHLLGDKVWLFGVSTQRDIDFYFTLRYQVVAASELEILQMSLGGGGV